MDLLLFVEIRGPCQRWWCRKRRVLTLPIFLRTLKKNIFLLIDAACRLVASDSRAQRRTRQGSPGPLGQPAAHAVAQPLPGLVLRAAHARPVCAVVDLHEEVAAGARLRCLGRAIPLIN